MTWQSPSVSVKWGPYSQPDPTEEKGLVEMVAIALGGGKQGYRQTITMRQALQKLSGVFGIENIDAALKGLEKEENERAERELDATKAALDAEARARPAGGNAPSSKPSAGGDSGRPPGG